MVRLVLSCSSFATRPGRIPWRSIAGRALGARTATATEWPDDQPDRSTRDESAVDRPSRARLAVDAECREDPRANDARQEDYRLGARVRNGRPLLEHREHSLSGTSSSGELTCLDALDEPGRPCRPGSPRARGPDRLGPRGQQAEDTRQRGLPGPGGV